MASVGRATGETSAEDSVSLVRRAGAGALGAHRDRYTPGSATGNGPSPLGAGEAERSSILRGRRAEQEELDRLIARARAGHSNVLVVRGEAGIGKTALLDYLVQQLSGCTVARANGVQADTELPFAALQQLVSPLLRPLERLPDPQRDAIEVAFGLRSGPTPDRFLVGLAVLGLLAEVSDDKPLVCVVDDAQWLDRASAETLAFVARRLLGEAVTVVLAIRQPNADPTFDRLPEMMVHGLGDDDARGLLESVITGRFDDGVIGRIVAESGGNPLALLELPYGRSAAELAGGFAVCGSAPVPERVEQSYLQRVRQLPGDTRQLLLLSAAEPVGDAALLLRAAAELGLSVAAAAPAEKTGLMRLGAQVRFRHPLVRSAIYAAASLAERQAVHHALAEATDAATDPDRKAWHRAHAALAPDEDVASELEHSAQRAQARGGMAAAAAFLERAYTLTVDPTRRAERALEAAQAKAHAGAFDSAQDLVRVAEFGPLDEFQQARLELLRAQLAYVASRGSEAPALLMSAATRLESLNVELARSTYLQAMAASMFAARLSRSGGRSLDVSRAALAAPRPPLPRAPDLLLDGLATLYSEGYAAGVPILRHAINAFERDITVTEELQALWLAGVSALHIWDEERWDVLSRRHVQLVREVGALAELPLALSLRIYIHLFAGQLVEAESLLGELDGILEAIGASLSPYGALGLVALRGREDDARALFEATSEEVVVRGEGVGLSVLDWAKAVLYNGLCRYDDALEAAQRVSDHPEDLGTSNWGTVELIEAAVRVGKPDVAGGAYQRLRELTQVGGTDWALGVQARSCALLSVGDVADGLYREAIERLRRSRLRLELARAHLLYGEWLRRERRRMDARHQLRTAKEMFTSMGAGAFDERVTRELIATGETARKRNVHATAELTAHEMRIARMARDGASNQDIATQLFVSRKTVEYHLHNVFIKLGISTREHLDRVLPGS